MRDLEVLAKQNGMSLKEAVADDGWRDGFARVADDLKYKFPSSFVEGVIEEGNGYAARISFIGDAPAEVSAEIEALNLPVPVQIRDGMGWSRDEAVTAMEHLFEVIATDDTLSSSATGNPGTSTGEVRITARPPVGVTVDEARTRIAAAAASENTPLNDAISRVPDTMNVVIDIDTALSASRNVPVYGGQQLRIPGGTSTACTPPSRCRRSSPSESKATKATSNGRASTHRA